MAASIGREIVMSIDGNPVAGLRTKSVKFGGSEVDISDGNSDGWRELYDGFGEKTIDISASCVMKETTFRDMFFADNPIHDLVLTYPDGGELAGEFWIGALSEAQEYKDAVTFDIELKSSGIPTYSGASTV